jgi:DNA end-binding protein Ku
MAAMAARAIWKGSVSFGLVNIPIQVFSATQKEDYTSFSQLCDKGHKIKYKKWCPIEEREVRWSEIKKGYEITKNNYVVLAPMDLITPLLHLLLIKRDFHKGDVGESFAKHLSLI